MRVVSQFPVSRLYIQQEPNLSIAHEGHQVYIARQPGGQERKFQLKSLLDARRPKQLPDQVLVRG